MGHQEMYWRQLEAVTVFVIWRERCRRIFSEKEQGVVNAAREVIRKYRYWFKSLKNSRLETAHKCFSCK
jgi:hypothetical protein